MIQRTFSIRDAKDMRAMAMAIRREPLFQSAEGKLLLCLTPGSLQEMIRKELAPLSEEFPDLSIAGMTILGPLSEEMKLPEDAQISLFLFEKSRVRVSVYDCTDTIPSAVGDTFLSDVQGIPDLQGIFLSSARQSMDPSPFVEKVSAALPNVPLFGAQAGASTSAGDDSLVFTGTKAFRKGILTACFYGKNLHLFAKSCFGWTSLGRSHEVTKTAPGRILTIDQHPAAELYTRYLHILPGQKFYQNSCAFPLIETIGGMPVARVPYRSYDDGSIALYQVPKEGTKVTLAYSKKGSLLATSRECAKDLALFQPEALLVIYCLNRVTLMTDQDPEEELSFYEKVCPCLCCTHGSSEIYRKNDAGGVMNSTLVCVGFRENEAKGSPKALPFEETAEDDWDSLPVTDRLVTFLEETTKELRGTIERLGEIAVSDQLTGIANRRKLHEVIERDLDEGRSISVLMIDIDFFKRINDTCGHQEGDQVLIRLTHLVQEKIRKSDLFARWGGEEFVGVFEGTSIEDTAALAERIRKAVEEYDFGKAGRVTVSIGVTNSCPEDTMDALFASLDETLYEAKRTGRNRVCVLRRG